MGRSPLMVGGDLPTSNSDAIALLQNPALREVLAGSTNNRETVRERIFGKWWDESTYVRVHRLVRRRSRLADGTRSAHHGGHYAALFWTGSDTYEIGRNIQLQSIVGLDARNDDWTLADLYADAPGEPATCVLKAWVPTASSPARFRRTACSGWPWTDAETEPASANQPPEPTARIVWRNLP